MSYEDNHNQFNPMPTPQESWWAQEVRRAEAEHLESAKADLAMLEASAMLNGRLPLDGLSKAVVMLEVQKWYGNDEMFGERALDLAKYKAHFRMSHESDGTPAEDIEAEWSDWLIGAPELALAASAKYHEVEHSSSMNGDGNFDADEYYEQCSDTEQLVMFEDIMTLDMGLWLTGNRGSDEVHFEIEEQHDLNPGLTRRRAAILHNYKTRFVLLNKSEHTPRALEAIWEDTLLNEAYETMQAAFDHAFPPQD
jgi:hypothetical protein